MEIQNVWSENKITFRHLLVLLILFITVNGMDAQQVIGQYPSQDGGFEGQLTGPLTTVITSTTWRVNHADLTGNVLASGARSGDKFVRLSLNNSITDYRHLQGPNMTAIPAGNHTIQFYYKGDKNADGDGTFGNIRGSIRGGNGSTGTTILASAGYMNVNNVDWTLYQAVINVSFATSNGLTAVQIQELIGKIAEFDIDDVVIYTGQVDVTPPNQPLNVMVDNPTRSTLDISWGAAEGGVDGGGYVVVRYAAQPNEDNNPNQHGIYAIGNTINNGTGSLTGTVRYIGTETTFTDNVGLSAATTYYYKVYTADKAFNYSAATTASGATDAESGLNDLNNSYSLHVFVNADKQIAVSLNDELNGVVNIYNVFGQRISSDVTTGAKTVLTKPFTSGVYFVTLVIDGSKTTRKVIIN